MQRKQACAHHLHVGSHGQQVGCVVQNPAHGAGRRGTEQVSGTDEEHLTHQRLRKFSKVIEAVSERSVITLKPCGDSGHRTQQKTEYASTQLRMQNKQHVLRAVRAGDNAEASRAKRAFEQHHP